MVKDEQGRYWTPTPPPAAKEIGPIFGHREFQHGRFKVIRHIPSSDATMSWLDCSRPIEPIKVGLCHGTKSSQLPLVSLSLKFVQLWVDDGGVLTGLQFITQDSRYS